MPSKPRPCPPRRCLALAVLLALPALAPAADDDAAAQCQIGVLKCAKKPTDWGMCGKNDLLDFYVAGLPVEGDRNAAERSINALKVSSTDKNHYTLEGKAEIRFFSTDGSARVWEIWKWPFAIRYSRMLSLVN